MEIEEVEKAVCKIRGITIDELKSKGRNQKIVLSRQMVWYKLRTKNKKNRPTFKLLATRYNMDHSSVIHGVKQMKILVNSFLPFKKAMSDIHLINRGEKTILDEEKLSIVKECICEYYKLHISVFSEKNKKNIEFRKLFMYVCEDMFYAYFDTKTIMQSAGYKSFGKRGISQSKEDYYWITRKIWERLGIKP